MRLREVPIYALVFGLLMSQQGLHASDCICVQQPMYAMPGGNFWLHSAIKTKDNCALHYPIPHVQPYTEHAEVCVSATDCGTCTVSGDRAPTVDAVTAFDLHTAVKPAYTSIDTEGEIREFLKTNTKVTGGFLILARRHLDEMVFESPIAANGPPVVKLSRQIGASSQDFYAVLWKMRQRVMTANSPHWGYIGIEIADSTPTVTVWPMTSVHRAFVHAKQNNLSRATSPVILKGLLEVQANNQVFMVRLHDSDENKLVNAFPMRSSRESQNRTFSLKVGEPTLACVSTATTDVLSGPVCCPGSVQGSVCRWSRASWRCGRRRCR